jgi:hypothetical protein
VYVIAFIISFAYVPSGGTGEKTGKICTDCGKCQAMKLDRKLDERLQAMMVEAGDTQKDRTKGIYKMEELDDLQYGWTAYQTKDGYYALGELCKGDETAVDGVTLQAEEWNYKIDPKHETYPAKIYSSSGQYSGFQYESNGEKTNKIKEPGLYQLYTYISHDGEIWYIADELEFEVK